MSHKIKPSRHDSGCAYTLSNFHHKTPCYPGIAASVQAPQKSLCCSTFHNPCLGGGKSISR